MTPEELKQMYKLMAKYRKQRPLTEKQKEKNREYHRKYAKRKRKELKKFSTIKKIKKIDK
jgi:uncharacterized protein YnzC (UPF0291/DUF896 family)